MGRKITMTGKNAQYIEHRGVNATPDSDREIRMEGDEAVYQEFAYGRDAMQPNEGKEAALSTNTNGTLFTEQAMRYWEQLRQKNFVDSHYMLIETTTRQQAAYIAELFAEKLKIKTKWKAFEDFWHTGNLAQERYKRMELGKLPSRSDDIDEVFKD